MRRYRRGLAVLVVALLTGCGGGGARPHPTAPPAGPASTTPSAGRESASVPPRARIAPLLDPRNVYAADRAGRLSPVIVRVPARVYVPNSRSNTVDVVDQRTGRI